MLLAQLAFGAGVPARTSSTSFQQAPTSPATTPQTAQQLDTLAPDAPVTGELSGGQKHAYQFALDAGEYAKVLVEQRGVDIVAHLFAADGHLIADVDAERTMQGRETVELVAEAAGLYRIEVEPSVPKAAAGAYAIQLAQAHAATPDERRLDEASRQYYEAFRLNDAGQLDQAIALSARSLATREQVLGTEHPAVAASLRALGTLYVLKLDAKQADAFLQRAAMATEKSSGPETLDYAEVLNNRARVASFRGDLMQAEELYQRALKIRTQAAGADSLPVANTLMFLGLLYRAMNDLPKAEQSFLQAVAIQEKWLGPEHIVLANTLNNFGMLYYGMGDVANAEKLIGRALSIKEKLLGLTHGQLGPILNNLGLVEWKKGDYARAKANYERALPIFARTSGPDSEGVASISHNLGIIYKEDGQNYARAEEYYRRALSIWEKLHGEDSNSTANAARSLAVLYKDMGDYNRAEQFALRALAIDEKLLGQNNQYTSETLRTLADVYERKGDTARAVAYYNRISAFEEKSISLNLTLGSERQKLAYFTQLERPDRIISLHVRLAPDDSGARDLAATVVLQRKGRTLDALSENLSALRRRFDPQDRALLDNFAEVNSQLSKLALSATQKASVEERETQLKKLEAERERLATEISRRSAGFYEGAPPVTLAAVRAAIPADAALVEFFIYRPFDWKGKEGQSAYGEPRYVAYVMRQQGAVRWVDLGAAKEIDAAVADVRQAFGDPQSRDVRALSRVLDERVMQPVRALLGDVTRLLVSPDGELNLIPFVALVDERSRYLVERYSFTYLTSGRDLLHMGVARQSNSNPVLVANPSFGEPAAGQIANNATRQPKTPNARRRSVTDARTLADLYFAPLGGTTQEARGIQTLFTGASLLTGEGATEAALKRVVAPNILHIATHGFFLQDMETSAAGTRTAMRGNGASVQIENPLLRSGLALAGANSRHGGGSDDGILTALEASGLNLWGTKLVVLSACDTGVGEVRNGEGVYGLRRAFVLAGSESLVMSLWPVSDYSTRRLMTDYYQNLKQGQGRGAALRQVQLHLLKTNPQLHPFYWANFIQSGEWANLNGER